MRIPNWIGPCALLALGSVCCAPATSAAPPADAKKATIAPEIASLLKASTAAYKKMHAYQHTARYVWDAGDTKLEATYILALDRPNKFCYKSDTIPERLQQFLPGGAAVSDGKTFFNYRG